MAAEAWHDVIPPDEVEIYRQAGFGKVFGFGQKPAVVVIDVEYGYVGLNPRHDISRAISIFPHACGPRAWAAVKEIKSLLSRARRGKTPVIYFHTMRKPGAKPKHDNLYGNEIVKEIKPRKTDLVFEKPSFSAFFGTNLVSHLVALKIDTLIVTGGTTSGCVRATVGDAYSYKYKVIVPISCVFDRAAIPHQVNLFDMNAKFADVVPLAEVMAYLDEVSET